MAGSWFHAVSRETGKLYNPQDLNSMLENGGDVWEFAEEAYGMVWYLARQLDDELPNPGPDTKQDILKLIEEAQKNYKIGIETSPGVDGELPEEV